MTSSNNLEIIGKKGSFSQFFSFKGKKEEEEEEERKKRSTGTKIKRLESQSHKKNIKKKFNISLALIAIIL